MFSYYYNKKSIDINRNSNLIKVWIKFIYTDEGKKFFSPNNSIDNELSLILFDYNKKIYQQLKTDYCHLSDIIRTDHPDINDIKWEYIKPESVQDEIFIKILNDYKIKRSVSNGNLIDAVHARGWVHAVDDDMFLFYYNDKNIKIDKQSKKIEVWVKEELLEKERGKIKSADKLNYSLTLVLFDYNNMKSQELEFINYFMSGLIKNHEMKNIEWADISPGDVYDKICNKILKDNNIQR